tara:strand:- start:459 stop:563 length:105 start_codon:yes stop_codon:yes gene_type:complete
MGAPPIVLIMTALEQHLTVIATTPQGDNLMLIAL